MRLTVLMAIALAISSCGKSERAREEERQRMGRDRNSAAFKAGQIAHEIAKGAGKAAAAAGRKVGEGARKAREGWNDQAQKDSKH